MQEPAVFSRTLDTAPEDDEARRTALLVAANEHAKLSVKHGPIKTILT